MLKLTSLALGLLTVLTIAPTSEAIAATNYVSPLSLQQPAADLRAQVIFRIGTPQYRYRQAELRRERARARARRRDDRRDARRDYRRNYRQDGIYRGNR
ncbi:hypothetical protein [Chamaesiphon sp.]|uniref:hypothetical protein n=1 Tax=Chamaesiphon sp. TaxID=2814140 RepID=UPI00359388F4